MNAEQAYLFRHAVMRDVAYQLILPSERGALHAMALAAWELEAPQAHFAAELAGHARAAELPEAELKYLRIAAPHARATWDNFAAAELYRRLADNPGRSVDEGVRALLKRCDALDALGDANAATQATREAVELSAGLDALSALALYGFAHQQLAHGDSHGALQSAASALEHAVRAGDTPAQARALVCQARALNHLGRGDESEALARRVLTIVHDAGDPVFEASMRGNVGFILLSRGHIAEGAALLEESVDALATGNADNYAQVLAGVGVARMLAGDSERARTQIEYALAFSRRIGNRRVEALCHSNLGVLWMERGDKDRAEQHFLQALAGHRELGNRASEARALGNIAPCYSARGDFERAADSVRTALRIAEEIDNLPQQLELLHVLSRVMWRAGRIAAAEAAAREGLHRAQSGKAATEVAGLHAVLADILLCTAREPQAGAELELAEAQQTRSRNRKHWAEFVLPTLFHWRLARGEFQAARDLLSDAERGLAEITRELTADAEEYEAAISEARAPMLWGGRRIEALAPATRRGLAAWLKNSPHGQTAAIAKLEEGLEDTPRPDWASADWLQE